MIGMYWPKKKRPPSDRVTFYIPDWAGDENVSAYEARLFLTHTRNFLRRGRWKGIVSPGAARLGLRIVRKQLLRLTKERKQANIVANRWVTAPPWRYAEGFFR